MGDHCESSLEYHYDSQLSIILIEQGDGGGKCGGQGDRFERKHAHKSAPTPLIFPILPS
jgi:hypothetical protein